MNQQRALGLFVAARAALRAVKYNVSTFGMTEQVSFIILYSIIWIGVLRLTFINRADASGRGAADHATYCTCGYL